MGEPPPCKLAARLPGFWGGCRADNDVEAGAVSSCASVSGPKKGGRPRKRRPWQFQTVECCVCSESLTSHVLTGWRQAGRTWVRACRRQHALCCCCAMEWNSRNPTCPMCRSLFTHLRCDERGGRDRGQVAVAELMAERLVAPTVEDTRRVDDDVPGDQAAAEALAAAIAQEEAEEEAGDSDEVDEADDADEERRAVAAALERVARAEEAARQAARAEAEAAVFERKLNDELHADRRCWLLALVLGGLIADDASDETASAAAMEAMRQRKPIDVELHGYVLYAVGDGGGKRRRRNVCVEVPPLVALLARAGLVECVAALRAPGASVKKEAAVRIVKHHLEQLKCVRLGA